MNKIKNITSLNKDFSPLGKLEGALIPILEQVSDPEIPVLSILQYYQF